MLKSALKGLGKPGAITTAEKARSNTVAW